MKSAALQAIFQLLKKNKEFPNYQAERRIDIFINYFLTRILTSFLKEETNFICPEFPLKVPGSNRSIKLDYLSKTKSKPVFVELKTDVNSLKESQAFSYINCDWQTCIDELKEIRKATKPVYRSRYDKLITEIVGMNFSNHNPAIRVIYITPLNKDKEPAWKKVRVSKPVRLSELKIDVQEDEKMVWEFIQELDLYIFEIVKKKGINNAGKKAQET